MVVETQAAEKCSACGTPLSREPWSEGLCPSCVFSLALEDSAVEADLLVEAGEAPTLQFKPEQTFSEGEIQGDRYRIRSLLGRGGMGEVWRAYDLKLRQDVALKALRTELIADQHALETLRQEVRTAREVISPNVCRVFDLQEVDGQELVAMEYVDGTTLQEILKERGPLELNEAREIATQFLAGLEAIHEAGLVHRDIKPENVMVTRTGRVVVMDFGLAKGLGEGRGGMVAGTPAYMSPEQSAGDELDARADLFSAGVMLAEMVEPGGMGTFEERRKLWEGIHQAEPQITDTPWSKVIAQAVSAETQERFESASALARALEEVTLRAAGDETARPYPGLSAFQQEDARFFFGRELEVEALWKKLRRPHLLAVIGPSGAGKSSFLRAGLLPTLTDGWQAIVVTPGSRPFSNLSRALAEALGEARGVSHLLARIEEPGVAVELLSQWRRRREHALLIVDQFEELFTQNPEDVQQRFADLLGRQPLEADLHVLLSMRDDFLINCQSFEALRPVFTEMTPLVSPTGASLRRAIVEPALRCGYRFEAESIVDEMLTEVEGERGALPMVAFAAAQLWERRDREQGLLTREAYEAIGGVGGALAQHAEATLTEIGEDGIPIVRELFRNLVTAQGTRAARDRDELLSVFGPNGDVGAPLAGARGVVGEGLVPCREGASPSPTSASPATGRRPSGERGAWLGEATEPEGPAPSPDGSEAAASVLDTLIDARLLTSYEVRGDDKEGSHHRIEIVHESLLKAWPRLVRWQTQDQEGAQLRDELRAQAQLWEQHGRSVDYLWTGTAYREFQLWRERYPGGLTSLEEAYARAMTAHAERRRRRRRMAVAAAFVLLVSVLSVVTWSRFEAKAEARRAEAAKLLAIAQLQLETDPTEALAFTTASLELADSEEARVFTMKALAEAPPARVVGDLGLAGRDLIFSEDGQWLAVAGQEEEVFVFAKDGRDPIQLPGHRVSAQQYIGAAWLGSRTLVTGHWTSGRVRLWSIPEGQVLREIEIGSMPGWPGWQVGETQLLAEVIETDAETGHEIRHLRAWELPDGEVEDLGTVDWTALGASSSGFEPGGGGWVYTRGHEVFSRVLTLQEGSADRLVGSHDHDAEVCLWHSLPTLPGHIWSRDLETNELRLWDLSIPTRIPVRSVAKSGQPSKSAWVLPDPNQRWLVGGNFGEPGRQLWDLEGWPGRAPLHLQRRGSWYVAPTSFDPESEWLAVGTQAGSEVAFWPLPDQSPVVVDEYRMETWRPVAFSPDSRWVVTVWPDNSLRLWPVPPSDGQVRTLHTGETPLVESLTFDPSGRQIAGTGYGPDLFVTSVDGGPIRSLEGFSRDHVIEPPAAFSPSGRLIAAGTTLGTEIEKALRVWNLDTGDVQVLDLEQTKVPGAEGPGSPLNGGVSTLAFVDETTLFSAAGFGMGILRWDLQTGTFERFRSPPGQPGGGHFWLSGDRRQMISVVWSSDEFEPWLLHDLATGDSRELETFWSSGGGFWLRGFDSTLSIAVGAYSDGTLGVARLGDPAPHLMVGHEGFSWPTISGDGQWIASGGEDSTLRLWPMPDFDKPPLHTLPRQELIAKLQSFTNLRAIRDEASSTGWSIEIGPFPGWAEVPEW